MKTSEQKQIISKILKSEPLSIQEMENIYESFKSNTPAGKKARSSFINEIAQKSSPEQFHQFVNQMFSHYTRAGGPFDSKKESLMGEPNIFRTAGAETFNKDLIVKEAQINGFQATISMENGAFNASFNELPQPVLAHFSRFQEFVHSNKGELAAEAFTRNLSFVICNNVLMEQAEKTGTLSQLMQSDKFQKASWLDHKKDTILEDIYNAAEAEKVTQQRITTIPPLEKPTSSFNKYIEAIKQLVNVIFNQPDPLKFTIDLVKSALGFGSDSSKNSVIPEKYQSTKHTNALPSADQQSQNLSTKSTNVNKETTKTHAVQVLVGAIEASNNHQPEKINIQEQEKLVSKGRS